MNRPNIIFYFSDQQRWDTVGAYGQELNITPTLDALAEKGTLFEEAYSPQPVCGPCRASFQSGKYPTEIGCFRNDLALPTNIKTLGNYMTEAGYETAYIGKWHLASQKTETENIDYSRTAIPLERRGGYQGFWRASDILEFTSHGYDGYVFDENNNKCEFKGYRVDKITDFGLEFLEQYNGKKPFFMTISHIEPHHQNDHKTYEGPDGSKKRFQEYKLPHDLAVLGGDAKEMYPDYLGCCRSLDDNLLRLVNKLKEMEIYDNTVIIYSSDHGSHFKTRNQDQHLNGNDDYKRSCHASATHVPLIISGPGFEGGKRIKELVSTISIPKTILAIAGIEVGNQMCGDNLAKVREDKNRTNQVFSQISESRVGRCLRTEDYLYAVYAPDKNGFEYPDSDIYQDDFLYDLKKDPYELTNLIANPAYAKVRDEMAKKLLDTIEEIEGKRPEILKR